MTRHTKGQPSTRGPKVALALTPAFDAWNAANERARREYATHPLAICLGIRRQDGEEVPCWHKRAEGTLCRWCARELRYAAERMAARRAS